MRGAESSCSSLKSASLFCPLWGGGHAETSFLLLVRTLSGIQPELINPNGTPDYPGCNGTEAGGLAGGKQRRVDPPPHTHLHHHKYHLYTHTNAPTV